MKLQLGLVAKNGFIALCMNNKLLPKTTSDHGHMLTSSQPQNSSFYARFGYIDKNYNLLLERPYGNTGCSDNSSRTSRPSTPVYYHARKSGGSERLNTGAFYKREWQSYNVCGIKQQVS